MRRVNFGSDGACLCMYREIELSSRDCRSSKSSSTLLVVIAVVIVAAAAAVVVVLVVVVVVVIEVVEITKKYRIYGKKMTIFQKCCVNIVGLILEAYH
ncbi:hypothetical protein ElyMa_001274300 [Elysia marginata]|uniref:Transmembrane protein n=1 Tax=Elysia marginata TaxID=1093978 RepID=A0AAV4IEX1_9GAST|nr:hypothetical protein ElyMa_001274300 [Elysia marginata]